jgi:hypothetical protein
MKQKPPLPSAPSLHPFDSNRRWYDEYHRQVEQSWDYVMQLAKELRTVSELRHALADVLDETAGGNFLSDATRVRVAPLVALARPDVLSTQWMQEMVRNYEQEQGDGH